MCHGWLGWSRVRNVLRMVLKPSNATSQDQPNPRKFPKSEVKKYVFRTFFKVYFEVFSDLFFCVSWLALNCYIRKSQYNFLLES